ncbi:hypothetical protein EDB84DRAFT_1565521 [Lactarius hengduanensis]|nr:hypothetical protein EDB84DRAFT_1565521 [Lactarius hengduanensis]
MSVLSVFWRDAIGATFVPIGAGILPNVPGQEVTVDIQYTEALTYPTPHIFYSTISEQPLLMWLACMVRVRNVPQTISMSFGGIEQEFAKDYAVALCCQFTQLGRAWRHPYLPERRRYLHGALAGSSSSPYSPHPVRLFSTCEQYTGAGTSRSPRRRALIGPFVTGVGGTIDDDPEIGAAFSGGRFSNYFTREE